MFCSKSLQFASIHRTVLSNMIGFGSTNFDLWSKTLPQCVSLLLRQLSDGFGVFNL